MKKILNQTTAKIGETITVGPDYCGDYARELRELGLDKEAKRA